VILAMHRLKKTEEGQTLVLAAIFGVLLMMCVLGTVNLGRMVYDKVQLQSAADAAAYSQAAVEARVMNYTAYTNRAMVVHYASIMSATSYLSWVHFLWGGLRPLLNVLQDLPYVGPVFAAINDVMKVLVQVLDYAVAILAPALSSLNLMLYMVQEGAWSSVYAKLLLAPTSQPEAHGGDSPQHAYQPIWPNLIPAMNAQVFSQTRGKPTMSQNFAQSWKQMINSTDPDVQMARMHMVEIANSARQPWVAHGDGYPNASISPLARHWKWKLSFGIGDLGIADVARTELGVFPPGGGVLGTLTSTLPQIWSGQKLVGFFDVSVLGVGFSKTVDVVTFAAMDQAFTSVAPYRNAYFNVWNPGGVWGKILSIIGLKTVLSGLQQAANATLPSPDTRFFFMSPYVSFAPRARSTPTAGLGDLGNFAQPDVLVGLAKERADLNREAGSSVFARRFTWNGGGAAGTGTVDFNYTGADAPAIPGVPGGLQLMHTGLNAFAAAQVYYHRPGEWREQPNLFNPLWGARLMPVAESNVYAKLGFANVPLLKQYMSH
jgi:hypothetical protein